MPVYTILATFQSDLVQCDRLIANSHASGAKGEPLLPLLDRKQITTAAFLNMYVAWETFLESSIAEFMVGGATISGKYPIKYVSPPDLESARAIVVGVNRYFDYGNPDYVRQLVKRYFQDGYPYEPHLSSIASHLNDLRTMRNAAAHITSTTQRALESLSQRILSQPMTAVDLYSLLTVTDPRYKSGDTVFLAYKNVLLATAEMIVQG